MTRLRRGFPARGGRKRQSTWIAPADQATVNVASGTSVIIASFDPAGAGMLAPTIVRSRGAVGIVPTFSGADLAISGAYGVCIVSDEAFAAGTASIPRPFDDADWGGWFVWRSFFGKFEFDVQGNVFPNNLIDQVDSKAMRKVSNGETIVMMAESQSGAIAIAMHLRLLALMS